MRNRSAGGVWVVATLVLSAACAESATSPTRPLVPNAGGVLAAASVAEGELKICKVGINSSSDAFTFGWVLSFAGGGTHSSGSVVLAPGACTTAAQIPTTAELRLVATVTEAAPPPNWALTDIGVVNEVGNPTGTVDIPQRSATAGVSNDQGALFTFTNTFTPPSGCTFTQGYWKTHPAAWPVASLTLGSVTYTQAQLIAILKQPVRGNGLVSLSYQLVAAKLNIAAGADPTDAAAAISAADALIGGLVVPPSGTGFLAPAATSGVTSTLDGYNNGVTGPGHC